MCEPDIKRCDRSDMIGFYQRLQNLRIQVFEESEEEDSITMEKRFSLFYVGGRILGFFSITHIRD